MVYYTAQRIGERLQPTEYPGAFSSLLFIAINVVAQTVSLRHTLAQTNSLCYRMEN